MTGSQRLHADVDEVPCGRCGSQPGEDCINTITGDVMPVPHWQRVKTSEETRR